MKVVSYLSTLPGKSIDTTTASKKMETLMFYIQGVNAVGDQGVLSRAMSWEPADVAVILGWVHASQSGEKKAPHLLLREEIVARQTSIGGRTIIADSNLFLYKDTTNPGYFLRYSYDGVFPDTGEYCDQNPNSNRWKIISKEIGLHLRSWRTKGNHILLCLQRNGGWSMGDMATVNWAWQTIKRIREFSDRTIILRGHPGDRQSNSHINQILKLCANTNVQKVQPSTNVELRYDLKNCWAMVNHNSSPAVGAAIEGIPVFVTDVVKSQAKDVANTDFSLLENPLMPDRQKWVERISQFHWSHAEIQNGLCWSHMKQWAKR